MDNIRVYGADEDVFNIGEVDSKNLDLLKINLYDK
jgi:YbbR domain-containing protein